MLKYIPYRISLNKVTIILNQAIFHSRPKIGGNQPVDDLLPKKYQFEKLIACYFLMYKIQYHFSISSKFSFKYFPLT